MKTLEGEENKEPKIKCIKIRTNNNRKKCSIFSPKPEDVSNIQKEYISGKSYNDRTILNGPSSSESLFSRWLFDRSKLSENINNNITDTFLNVFPHDMTCKGRLGKGGRPYIISNSCVGCTLLGRLFSRGKESSNTIITIQGGGEVGKKLNINHIPYENDKLLSYKVNNLSSEYNKIVSNLPFINSCETGYINRINKTSTFSTKSPYTNYATISSIIEQEMITSNIPGIPIFRWLYECSDGLIVVDEEISKSNSMDILTCSEDYTIKSNVHCSIRNKLRPDVSRLLITQLILILSFLNKYDFTHGDPSLENIKITNNPCSIVYDTVKVESPFTLHIIPSEKSSITLETELGPTRIFNCEKYNTLKDHTDIGLKFKAILGNNKIFEPCVNSNGENIMCEIYQRSRILLYKITDGKNFEKYTNDLGIALFPSSFDCYAFFLSFMKNDEFYESVISDLELYDIWVNMWDPEEFPFVMQSISSLRSCEISVKEFLYKFHLRCDCLKFLWGTLKNINYP